MPSEVDVNGVQFHIFLVNQVGPAEDGIVGHTSCSARTIVIARNGLGIRRQTILMHELSHAAVCGDDFHPNNMYYNSTTNEDHEGIYKFAEIWSEMLRRNPALARYMGA